MTLLAPVRGFWYGLTAVLSRELRGRMRGRRAFVIVTIYLLLLGAVAFGIYAYLQRQADLDAAFRAQQNGDWIGTVGGVSPGYALSASIGHLLFTGILVMETLLVLVLAPAFTAGAISSEREHQTLDLLVTTPLSTLGIVVGKLISALAWVLMLIVASVPLMSVVFVFGSVGPEDVIRAYVLLFTLAFGMGSVGLFLSALVRRTQAATVLASVVVLVLALGTIPVHALWSVLGTTATTSSNGLTVIRQPNRGPDALLWLNPLVGDMDLICTTAPGGYERLTCDYVAAVTHTPFFSYDQGGGDQVFAVDDAGAPIVQVDAALLKQGVAIAVPAPARVDLAPDEGLRATFGFPRDTFWPRNALAFVVLGVVLTLLSTQLVAPTRRLGLRRPGRGDDRPTSPQALDGTEPANQEPTPLAETEA